MKPVDTIVSRASDRPGFRPEGSRWFCCETCGARISVPEPDGGWETWTIRYSHESEKGHVFETVQR